MVQSDRSPETRDAELKSRLESLASALKSEKQTVADGHPSRAASQSASSMGTAMGMGLRVGSELFAGTLVGGLTGWGLDRWLGTSPLFLLIMLLLGMAAGFWNVYRVVMRSGSGSMGGSASEDLKKGP